MSSPESTSAEMTQPAHSEPRFTEEELREFSLASNLYVVRSRLPVSQIKGLMKNYVEYNDIGPVCIHWRFDKRFRRWVSTDVMYVVLESRVYNDLMECGFNDNEEVELTPFEFSERHFPSEDQTYNLYVRLMRDFSEQDARQDLERFFESLIDHGVLLEDSVEEIRIPIRDRTGRGVHGGYAIVTFSEGTEPWRAAVARRMLHDRNYPRRYNEKRRDNKRYICRWANKPRRSHASLRESTGE